MNLLKIHYRLKCGSRVFTALYLHLFYSRIRKSNRCSTYSIEEQAQTDQLGRLVQYIRRQWIESEVFTPRNWCVYKEPVRTNNDLEGWHNALNRWAGGQCGLPLYLLIELLDREAKLTAITIRLVSDNKLKRIQRRTTRNIQANYSQVGRSMRTTRKLLLNYSGRARVWMDQRALTDHERTELAWSKLRIRRFCK